MNDHKVIYLIPDDNGGAMWCEDPAPEPGMEEYDAIKYIKYEEIAARDRLINNVVDVLDELRLPHSTCDDCWYSCPKSEDGCCNDDVGAECNCGADEHNSIIDKLIKQARELVK